MMHKGITARTSISGTAGWPRSPGRPRHRWPAIHPGRSRQTGSKIYGTCPSRETVDVRDDDQQADPGAGTAFQDFRDQARAAFVLEQLRERELTPSALITLLLLKTAAGNPRITAELRPWAGQLRAVLDQPGGGEAFIAILTYIELVSEAPASELRNLSCGQACQAVSGKLRTAALAKADLLPVQQPCPDDDERLNSVTGLPAPLRVLCGLTRSPW